VHHQGPLSNGKGRCGWPRVKKRYEVGRWEKWERREKMEEGKVEKFW
jgi:hypothetical protein